MKALVVGYGSIGQRHARLLAELGLDVAVVCRRDTDVAHARFAALPEALAEWRPDYIVVASATEEHGRDIETIAAAGFEGTVLVEKPLLDQPREIDAGGFAAAHVGYNLRFHPLVVAVRERLDGIQVFAANAYVGQDLRQWRPAADYRESYSADRKRGGGVLRDLSHELDLVNAMFGGWTSVSAAGGKLSDLEIDSDDVFSLLIEARRCPAVNVHLNYLDSDVTREMRFQTSAGTIVADLVRSELRHGGERLGFEVARDDTYLAQHRAVLRPAEAATKPCSFAEGLDVVRLIDAAEASARSGSRIAA